MANPILLQRLWITRIGNKSLVLFITSNGDTSSLRGHGHMSFLFSIVLVVCFCVYISRLMAPLRSIGASTKEK